METQCTQFQMEFKGLRHHKVQAALDGSHISTDGGALLLREIDARLGLTERFSGCFTDHRQHDAIEHSLVELVCHYVTSRSNTWRPIRLRVACNLRNLCEVDEGDL